MQHILQSGGFNFWFCYIPVKLAFGPIQHLHTVLVRKAPVHTGLLGFAGVTCGIIDTHSAHLQNKGGVNSFYRKYTCENFGHTIVFILTTFCSANKYWKHQIYEQDICNYVKTCIITLNLIFMKGGYKENSNVKQVIWQFYCFPHYCLCVHT